jgi:transporter family-2 protein
MQSFYMIIALLGGIVLPVQVGLNSILARATGNPIWASSVSFLVGTVGIILYLLAQRQPLPSIAVLSAIPPYAWAGGLLGAFYVTISIIVAPKIGAAMLVCLAIAGQMVAALIMDHYGLLGFPQHSINWGRVAGAIMLIGGVLLMRKY